MLALEEEKSRKKLKNKNHPQGHCIMDIIAKAMGPMAIKITNLFYLFIFYV